MNPSAFTFAPRPAFDLSQVKRTSTLVSREDAFYRPTKAGFMMLYKSILVTETIWRNSDMLERFMARVDHTINTGTHPLWNHDHGPAYKAFRKITGAIARPTLSDLRKLPDGPATRSHALVLNHYRWQDVMGFTEWLEAQGHTYRIVTKLGMADSVDGVPIQKDGPTTSKRAAEILNALYRHYQIDIGHFAAFDQ